MKNYLNAIVFIATIERTRKAAKYHNVKNEESSLKRFEYFLTGAFPTWVYVNYYHKETSKFAFRRYSK